MEPNVYYNAPYVDEVEHADIDHTGIPGVGGGGGLTPQTTATLISKANYDVAADTSEDVAWVDGVSALSTSPDTDLNVDGIRIDVVTAGVYVATLTTLWTPKTEHVGKRQITIIGSNLGSDYGTYPFIAGGGIAFNPAWDTGSGTYAKTTSLTGYLPAGAHLKLRVNNTDPAEIQRIAQLVFVVYRIG